ncbi:MAG: HD domain-containing protein [Ruminococcus sp.]|nr:HD domain-containing protein [Ruminococcus sp.]
MYKKNGSFGYVRTTAVLFLCILINYAGRVFASYFELPGWLDSFGTFLAAYIAGPIPGAIVGATSNFIIALTRPVVAAYSVVSIFIALAVGWFARKKYFDTLFNTTTVAGSVTVGSAVISTVFSLVLSEGSTNNVWGDGVKDYFMEIGLPKIPSVFIGEFYLEFADKLLTALMMFATIKIIRALRKRDSKRLAKDAAILPAILLLFGAVTVGNPDIASAEDASEKVSYIQTVYSGDNGLPPGHANAVAQTNDGILWIGTYAGLYRYNGTEFTHMSQLTNIKNVNCLYVDDEGRLWVGTNDTGLAIVIDGKVTNVLTTSDGLPSDSIRSITQNASGEYYIGTSDGVVELELKIGFSVKSVISELGYVGRMDSDSKGTTAAVNSEGDLYLIRGGQAALKKSPDPDCGNFSCCSFGPDDTLFVGATDGIIYELDISSGSFKELRSDLCGSLTKINCITHASDGTIWICSDNGIGCLDKNRNFTKQESNEFDHSVENMTADYQGNLWFASSRLGLLRMTASPVTDIYADTGLEPSVVNSTALFGGLLYAGTDDGLTIIDISKHFSIKNELTELLDGSRIRCIIPDSSGNLWICSYGAGLISVDRSGNITRFSEEIPELGSRVRVAYELSDGSVVVGSSEGVFFIMNGALIGSIPFSDEFGYAQALCFLETEGGTLYAGTDGNGITVIRREGVVRRLVREDGLTSEVILRLVADPIDGSIYIVTSNSISRMENEHISTLSNFPYSNNYDIIIDDDGEMFIPGSAGIYVVDREELLSGNTPETVLLDSKMGMIGSLTANAWNAVDQNKRLYISADRGVFSLDLDRYIMKQRSFRLKVSEIRIDDETKSIDRSNEFAVARDTAKVEFVPEIINYTLEDPTVSYYLEGFDTDWTNVRQSELLTVVYTNLDPGKYTFHLAVRDDKGEILEESSYSIRKDKAIYDNIWFKIYLITVAGIFVGWLTWFITRQQMQHTLQLQEAELTMALHQVQMGNETILAIAKTVDAKDLRTSKHSQRVSDYSAMIAAEYGFTPEECENLRKAALLHDIGKIAIPDSVLNKPARLTDEEYATMKTHVTRGAEILKDFTLIEHVVEGARYHHERYDGRGYPDGLKGHDIPLYGRIIAIADAFDAMTANRVYRKKQDIDYVMGELHRGRGTQFDPELLDIFLKLIDEKKIDIDALYKDVPQEVPETKPAEDKASKPEESKPDGDKENKSEGTQDTKKEG